MAKYKASSKAAPASVPGKPGVAAHSAVQSATTVKNSPRRSPDRAVPAPTIELDPQTRIDAIRQGIPASSIGQLSTRMGMSKGQLLASLGLSHATISRKERAASLLSKHESERVLGIEKLIGQVQKMVDESGDPLGFDAARWVSDWLCQPLPALGGKTPASYMDTFEGQNLVAQLLSLSQSGAYA
jgi:putative toxin-antitoxin system antitoxin component (TIGR02293 family)